MRGKLVRFTAAARIVGITPADAGKTNLEFIAVMMN